MDSREPSASVVAPTTPASVASPAPAAVSPDASGIWPNARFIHRSIRDGGPGTFRYLFRTETHTYAFSVAANAVLSFLPFVMMLLTITRRLDHFLVKHYHVSHVSLRDIVIDLLRDYLPVAQRTQDFIVSNIDHLARARQGVQIVSVLMLLISSTGIFLPLEVALNRIWGFANNRSYLRNQAVSLGLACACVVLALISVGVTAGGQRLLLPFFPDPDGLMFDIAAFLVRRIIAILASFATFFLIYWVLPNGKVPIRAVARAAIAIGLVWEVSKYLFILCLPLLDFQEVYGPFAISVTLIFWSFLSGLLLLSGAHLSRANMKQL